MLSSLLYLENYIASFDYYRNLFPERKASKRMKLKSLMSKPIKEKVLFYNPQMCYKYEKIFSKILTSKIHDTHIIFSDPEKEWIHDTQTSCLIKVFNDHLKDGGYGVYFENSIKTRQEFFNKFDSVDIDFYNFLPDKSIIVIDKFDEMTEEIKGLIKDCTSMSTARGNGILILITSNTEIANEVLNFNYGARYKLTKISKNF